MFKSDIPASKSGPETGYKPGPATIKEWKSRAHQDSGVSNQKLYTPPTTLEYVIRKPPGNPAPPPPPAAPSGSNMASRMTFTLDVQQNGHPASPSLQRTKPLEKKDGKKTFRNYVYINEYDSNQQLNGIGASNDSISTQNSSQYYNSHERLPPPRPARKPFNIRRVRVSRIYDGAIGRTDKFRGLYHPQKMCIMIFFFQDIPV